MQELEYKIDRAAEVMTILGNPQRLQILCRLFEQEMSVSQLAQQVGMPQPTLSQHLAKLRSLNLVKVRRSAQKSFYTLEGDEIRTILSALHQLYCADES